jgi:hypothetical protein
MCIVLARYGKHFTGATSGFYSNYDYSTDRSEFLPLRAQMRVKTVKPDAVKQPSDYGIDSDRKIRKLRQDLRDAYLDYQGKARASELGVDAWPTDAEEKFRNVSMLLANALNEKAAKLDCRTIIEIVTSMDYEERSNDRLRQQAKEHDLETQASKLHIEALRHDLAACRGAKSVSAASDTLMKEISIVGSAMAGDSSRGGSANTAR